MTDEPNHEEKLEELFEKFLRHRPASEQRVYKGRLADLEAFERDQFKTLDEPNILTKMKKRINERLHKYGKLIQPPHGPATIHLEFIAAALSNGLTFVEGDVYFIGITSQMLLDFKKASGALAASPLVSDLLVAPVDGSAGPALFNALLAIQVQFIVFHELGHIFHAHHDARSFREEYHLSPKEKLLLLYPDLDREQAREFLADRYAVRMLLGDLISTKIGANMHTQIRSKLSPDECILWLILLATGSVFFVGPGEPFHIPLIRKRDHPIDLARMNIVMRSIVEWSEPQKRPDIVTWASTQNFEWATACIQDAAPLESRRDDWIAQGKYLQTDAGRDYLDIIYKEEGVITQEMIESWWKIQPS